MNDNNIAFFSLSTSSALRKGTDAAEHVLVHAIHVRCMEPRRLDPRTNMDVCQPTEHQPTCSCWWWLVTALLRSLEIAIEVFIIVCVIARGSSLLRSNSLDQAKCIKSIKTRLSHPHCAALRRAASTKRLNDAHTLLRPCVLCAPCNHFYGAADCTRLLFCEAVARSGTPSCSLANLLPAAAH